MYNFPKLFNSQFHRIHKPINVDLFPEQMSRTRIIHNE